MRFETYLRVEGVAFEPAVFDSSLPAGLRGRVVERKHVRSSPDRPMRLYWESRRVVASASPEDGLAALLAELHDALRARRALDPTIKISAQVVMRYSHESEPIGYYFSREIVGQLAELGGDLDIDAALDLAATTEDIHRV